MFFLKWWQPSTWLSGVSDGVIGAVIKGLRSIFYTIISMIYRFIIDLYWLFNTLCTGRLLDNNVMTELSKRIGLILGIIMLFYVIFAFIKMLVDPDIINDKTQGAASIIKKCIIVIVMLGVSSFVFDTLYMIQRVVVQNNIISKVLLPYDVDTDNFGGILSAELLGAFYKISDSIPDDKKESESEIQVCQQVVNTLQNKIVNDGDFELGNTCLNESVKIEQDDNEEHEVMMIDFNWLLGIAVGIAVIYFLIVYCINVGVRMIQLAVLEIISPMAIVSYLAPKQDTMFSKWSKLYISTYIDVFIRIAIINFSVFLIATIFDTNGEWAFWNSLGNPRNQDIIMLVMVVALLAFAKKAPDLIKDLFPTGSSKIGFGTIKKSDILGGNAITTGAKVATAGTAIGLLGAASSGYSRYRINRNNGQSVPKSLLGGAGGVISAVPRGLAAGAAKGNVFSNISKGWEAQRGVDDKYDELITGGGNTFGKVTSHLSAHFGETKGQMYTRVISNNEQVGKHIKNIEDTADKFSSVKVAKTNWENAKARGDTDTEIKRLYDAYKAEKDRMTTLALSGGNVGSVKDQVVAEQIKVSQADISSMISSGKVVLKRADGTQIDSGDVNSSAAMDDISIASSRNISSIKMQSDYSAAIQNDKSAGVNSSKKN